MKVTNIYKAILLCLVTAGCYVLTQNRTEDNTISVNVSGAGSSGIVWFESPRPIPPGSQIKFSNSEFRIEGQYIPSFSRNGWLTTILPPELVTRSRTEPVNLKISINEGTNSVPVQHDRIDIHTPAYTLTQRTDVQAGFPSRISFSSGRVLDSLTWGDRLYGTAMTGSDNAKPEEWRAVKDPKSGLVLISDGPVCTVVRQTVHFMKNGKNKPLSHPKGIYQWVFFKTKEGPVYLETRFDQESSFCWEQLHFAELHIDNVALPEWHGSNNPSAPATHGTIS